MQAVLPLVAIFIVAVAASPEPNPNDQHGEWQPVTYWYTSAYWSLCTTTYTIYQPIPYISTVPVYITGKDYTSTSYIYSTATRTVEEPVTTTSTYYSTITTTYSSVTTSFITQNFTTTDLDTTTIPVPTTIPTTVDRTLTTSIPYNVTSITTYTENGTTIITTTAEELFSVSTFTDTEEVTQYVTTIIENNTTFLSTVFQTVSGPTITQAGPTFSATVTLPGPITYITPAPLTETITYTTNITVTAPTGTCNVSIPFPFPTPDAAFCGGEECSLGFELGGAIRYEVMSNAPPLVTELVFVNQQARQTCITTSCNTEVFSSAYYTSLGSCAYPPCLSNSIDCDCSIVVKYGLPGGDIATATQTGPNGWNLYMGPAAAGNAVPTVDSCGLTGCVSSTRTTFFTPIVYTGAVETGSLPSQYILPDLAGYFPSGNPFGGCSVATLRSPTQSINVNLLKRQEEYKTSRTNTQIVTLPAAPRVTPRKIIPLNEASTTPTAASQREATKTLQTSRSRSTTTSSETPATSSTSTGANTSTSTTVTEAALASVVSDIADEIASYVCEIVGCSRDEAVPTLS